MARPDADMRRMSDLLTEARSIASRRDWPSVGRALDQAEVALLRVEPNNGEKGQAEFRPTFEAFEPKNGE